MEIPKQLQNPDFRFVLLGKADEWKNTKTKEVTTFPFETYDELKQEKDWMPLGKAPFEKEWQKNGYKYDDKKLLNHIKTKNYGVIGGYGNLIIIDCDDKEFADEMKKIIDTFTIETGGGGNHLYITSDYKINHVFAGEVGELRAKNYQVVGASCIHPNGNEYKVVKDLLIKYISSDELKEIIKPYLRPEIEATTATTNKQKDETRSGKEWREIIKLIAKELPKEQVFKEMGVYAKWSSAPEQYRELSYKKAVDYVKKYNLGKKDMSNQNIEVIDEEALIKDAQRITGSKEITLKDVYKIYKKWLKVSDDKRIDLGLAVALTRELKGTKIWVWIIGASGDWKSEQINALNDGETTYIIRSITKNTLVTGFKNAKDLAPELKDKLVLIPEGAQILTVNKDDKNAIFSQLRDLYDGYAGADKGSGTRAKHKDLNVTLLAGSTPYIDGQQLIHQQLGTRELFYRTPKTDVMTEEEIMNKIDKNVNYKEQMRKELRIVTLAFIRSHHFESIEPNERVRKKIRDLVNYIRLMRASAEIDYSRGELRAEIFPEQPTRIYEQFLNFYSALKSLDLDYSDDRVLELLEHIAKSSASQNRVKVLNYLIKMGIEQVTNNISTKLRLGYKTVYTELNILWNLNIITRKEKDTDTSFGIKSVKEWKINRKHKLVKAMTDEEKPLFKD